MVQKGAFLFLASPLKKNGLFSSETHFFYSKNIEFILLIKKHFACLNKKQT